MAVTGVPRATAVAAREVAAPARLARSALTRRALVGPDADRWFADRSAAADLAVRHVPLDGLTGWHTDPRTGDLAHDSGRFFAVRGIEVTVPDQEVSHWNQPIIHQPEVGVLGILVREFGGVPHLLMQAKVEPGNVNGVQLSPTVQATRSNYTGVHRGRSVPYLSHFLDVPGERVLVDVRHSEQGAWFYRKRNRNVVVEVDEDLPVLDGFRWFTLGEVHQMLARDNAVNMDARTVLACLPFAGEGIAAALAGDGGGRGDGFRAALARSCEPGAGSAHTTGELLRWISEIRTRVDLRTAPRPLAGLSDWRHHPDRVSHRTGAFFDVVGVAVHAPDREVAHWAQPMIRPCGLGLAAFLVTRIGGVLHALVHARAEAGCADVVELAPTVQCTPANYRHLPARARPRYLDAVLGARPERVRLAVTQSEEGGRFYHARTRHVVVEVDAPDGAETPRHRWVALHQFVDLLRHSHYVNIQARSLVACLYGLAVR
ncbi:NDP-hexose 2,3-dehydratase family protein [Goodfellowiella coeruleoviolacea]|uniref:Oxidase EvaA n=1 Tax=Goodfellowiella coeruleoviolacea TaxID=334858 RepID=A0AAE3GGJ2_9PSEU|nr:NDP-hexose 2,3-dehydratase family protein [Goodfellowiella coeruleoviolacea]MCP2167725.1 oxidase EvaA [Goodfellowiella coeruleoviolacea]